MKGHRRYIKTILYYVKFYERDSELHETYCPVRLGKFKGKNGPGENLKTLDFNEIEIVLLIFTESQESLSGNEYRFDY